MPMPARYKVKGLTVKGLAVAVQSPENLIGNCLHRALEEVGVSAPGLIISTLPSDEVTLVVGEKP